MDPPHEFARIDLTRHRGGQRVDGGRARHPSRQRFAFVAGPQQCGNQPAVHRAVEGRVAQQPVDPHRMQPAVDAGADEMGMGRIFADGFESGDTSAWSSP